ncbi:zinc-ribbon domain-containing protein [Escherichia coli]|uniref:zinc-ribbon domain-containing protein n=1 Tax=Escherichia coli TaxID=562 RepID=UPI0020B26DF1|nr:zinc-ribbon domain-containing protein [Escherichia coli]MCP3552397.1 zinc-ribbon domain-containing protein [Escherichia coli]
MIWQPEFTDKILSRKPGAVQNGLKTGLGITPGEHIISADSALSRNIRHCFCLSCRGRLILQTDAQGAWFEHDLHALSEQQKAACVVLNPEKSHPYIDDMAMFLSPLPVVLEWHCVMCGQHFPGKKFCEACGTGIYSRAVCTKYVYSYQPDLFQDCGSANT